MSIRCALNGGGWSVELSRQLRRRVSPLRRSVAEALERRVLLATVNGLKFNDLDGDGVGEVGEPGLSGWTIYHDANNNNVLDAGEPRDVTDATGNYSISFTAGLIAPTPETIREVPRAGWRPTTPASGEVTLAMVNSQTRNGVNFGNTQLALVTGIKFNDLDGDGVRDAGEGGLGGWTIFVDRDNDGALDASEPRDITAADGSYSFSLPTSTADYRIREVSQAGWRQTAPGPQHAPGPIIATLDEPAMVSAGRNFGNTQRVLITGQKFDDLDANGVRTGAEPGLAGWTIYLDTNNNSALDAGEPRDTTDSTGRYSFSPAGTGPFRVREVPQARWRQTAPDTVANGNSYLVVFTAPADGAVASNRNFLNTRRPRVTGIKFNDQDADGVRDVGEPGLSPVPTSRATRVTSDEKPLS